MIYIIIFRIHNYFSLISHNLTQDELQLPPEKGEETSRMVVKSFWVEISTLVQNRCWYSLISFLRRRVLPCHEPARVTVLVDWSAGICSPVRAVGEIYRGKRLGWIMVWKKTGTLLASAL